ncbi:MAG: hypothetical protein AB1604_03255 [Euryarchaeota archaeon]
MFKIFGQKKDEKEDILEIVLKEEVDCVGDFTYNFYWQHQGEKLDPDEKIPGNDYSFRDVVEHLKAKKNVKIKGNVGHRLCSSMGVDIKYFGGSSQDIEVGTVMVDGNVDSRMGISMVQGTIYIKGELKTPVGNLLELESDKKGYRKFKSITDIIKNGLKGEKLIGARLSGKQLLINDGMVKDTVGARLDIDAEIVMEGDVDLSTGILMRQGRVIINGNAGKNTGALLNGGTVVINGDCDDFTAIEMKKGLIIVNGDAGKFLGAQKKKGKVLAKKGSPIPPTTKKMLDEADKKILLQQGYNPHHFQAFE